MKSSLFLSLLLVAVFQACGQDFAKAQLEASPRHQEWVTVTYGDRTVNCFLVYPEVADKAQTIIVIHENMGLTDWARSMTDQFAEMGYIAIAPDLLSGAGPDGAGTAAFSSMDEARKAIYALNADQVTHDLDAVFAYAKALPASNGEVSVAGFCWGGSQSFRYATNQPNLATSLVFYGTGPDSVAAYQSIKVPVYGFYGGNDARVNATIPQSEAAMKEEGKKYEAVIYEGAGHGFMRSGQAPDAAEANAEGRKKAIQRVQEILNKN